MRYLIIITLSLFLLQCFSSSKSRKPRGKLGDVMEKASDDYEGERTVKTKEREAEPYYVEEDEPEATVMAAYQMQGDSTQADSLKVKQNWMFSFKYEFGLNSRDYFRRMNQTELGIGFYSDRIAVYGYAGYGWNVTNENTFIGKTIKSPASEYLLGLEFHYYTTPDWTFMGHRVFGGFNWGILTWDYKNPVEIEDTNEIISSDNIKIFHLFVGTGINITQTKFFNLGGYATAGGRFYNDITGEGFENDRFKTEGFIKIGFIIDIGHIR